MVTPTTPAIVEIVGDRVVGIALIIGICFCVREVCRYKERLAAANAPPADGGAA